MSELVWFRLFLLVAVLQLAAGFGFWSYSSYRAHLAHEQLVKQVQDNIGLADACRSRTQGASFAQCGNPLSGASLEAYENERTQYEEKAKVSAWMTVACTSVLFVVFYGLRWALTGKLRPLWLLGKRTEH